MLDLKMTFIQLTKLVSAKLVNIFSCIFASLIRNDEILGLTLISLHNIAHLIRYTNAISSAIKDNCFTNDFAPWKTSSIAHHTW